MKFAHSLPYFSIDQWEPLSHHLEAVGLKAAAFASQFGFAPAAEAAGRLHDIGKCSKEFQKYISSALPDASKTRGPDHSTAGAKEAIKLFPGPFGKVLAFAIAGHHAGLANGVDLEVRLSNENTIPSYTGWQSEVGPLPDLAILNQLNLKHQNTRKGFQSAFLTRMLFSCLVDADFLATEEFYAAAKREPPARGDFLSLSDLKPRLDARLSRLQTDAKDTPVNRLRADVLAHATAKASEKPGLFTLTVPTGGGKTLTSISFALDHAVRHGLRRIAYVIPYTSIIDQTAAVFRDALGTQDDILEHHSSFDWEDAARGKTRFDDEEGRSGVDKLRRAAENWDAPIIVTTAVQFFESLFAARTSRCRKLHNLARSVIVLDEVQTLPIKLLQPCIAAIDELTKNYGASAVLCTATQPALRLQDEFKSGLDIPETRELAPHPDQLFESLKRVSVERKPEPIDDREISARFAETPQMLCIVNSRAHARSLFETIRSMDGAAHLTTLMCPRHRRAVLANIRERLSSGLSVRLVSTSLIEAGVDIDFPEVWRAAAGLESIAQAAGRCNREGRLSTGRLVVFESAESKPPSDLKQRLEAARSVMRRHADPLSCAAILDYFQELYWSKGPDAFDLANLDGKVYPILERIAERASSLKFPFDDIATAFRMIDEAMTPVIVPWTSGSDDVDARTLLDKIAASERPRRDDLRRLQLYSVPIPRAVRESWLKLGALGPVHSTLGSELLAFSDLSHYDPQIGLKLDDFGLRNPEANVIA